MQEEKVRLRSRVEADLYTTIGPVLSVAASNVLMADSCLVAPARHDVGHDVKRDGETASALQPRSGSTAASS
jgi:hypothetical protein